jgi:hypothetical protein
MEASESLSMESKREYLAKMRWRYRGRRRKIGVRHQILTERSPRRRSRKARSSFRSSLGPLIFRVAAQNRTFVSSFTPTASIETRSRPRLTHVLPPISTFRFSHLCRGRPRRSVDSPLPVTALPSVSLIPSAPFTEQRRSKDAEGKMAKFATRAGAVKTWVTHLSQNIGNTFLVSILVFFACLLTLSGRFPFARNRRARPSLADRTSALRGQRAAIPPSR